MGKIEKPYILVTNDDGIHAGGLKALIDIARSMGNILVVAPDEPQSGMSHAITTKVPLRLRKIHVEEGLLIYSCNGTPVDCVKIALNEIGEKKPDLIISGINHGSNAATSVVYSATMGAAIEGCLNNIPSAGFSLLDFSADADFSSTRKYVTTIIKNILDHGLPKGTCLNVNIPLNKVREIKGIKICRQNKGYWKEEFDKRTDPSKKDYFWLTGSFHNVEPEANDTDEWALKNNYVSVVPVNVDFTAYESIQYLRNWKLNEEI